MNGKQPNAATWLTSVTINGTRRGVCLGAGGASAGGPTWSLARSNTRLWAFKDTRLTSFNGTHGTILGPWATHRIIGTRGGAPTGTVVLWPSNPWNNGHNFTVWWRAAS
jgi:hypothetical protein